MTTCWFCSSNTHPDPRHLYYDEMVKKTMLGGRDHLFDPLCSVFALPRLAVGVMFVCVCLTYLCVCVAARNTERLSDSAEHGDTGVGGSRKSMRGV